MAVAAPDRIDRSRRALLRGRVRPEPAAVRPPWALDESRFTDACTGCGDCVAACPERVLVRGADGLPEFDPRLGECTFCRACATACRQSAFVAPDEPPWRLQPRIGEACLAANGIVCSSCRDACGESAIRFPPVRAVPVPQVLDDRCSGCGACVSACPVAAISLARLPREEAVDA